MKDTFCMRILHTLFRSICIWSVVTSVYADVEMPRRYEAVLERNAERITVVITRVAFDSSKHNIDKKHWKIDGRQPYGVDGNIVTPEDEIGSFEVSWNGKKVVVSKELYSDCFTPVLFPQYKESFGSLSVASSENGDAVMISMRSERWVSAPYSAQWIICKDGHHTRFIQDNSGTAAAAANQPKVKTE